ncbi:SMI1/KNR4 family protein [Streptomyces sp. NPDC023723]|uniref:SMI1/KNR4 family protein n=1 Tax=Streptomyces sp. NPDC023723 TaxID=3154323 RepID=UPI0033D911A3
MSHGPDRSFPPALAAALAVSFEYDDGKGVDFEPFPAFLSRAETTDWLRSWTGNPAVDGDAFRVFGRDGTGGYAAFWMLQEHQPLTGQPVVFLGSEGETGVVARDLGAFLWLLAGGYGPWEAATSYEPGWTARSNHELTVVAEQFAADCRLPAPDVLAQAAREFPHFDDFALALCR